MPFEIETQADDRPWGLLRRRFDTIDEAAATAKKMIELYIETGQFEKTIAVRFRKVD